MEYLSRYEWQDQIWRWYIYWNNKLHFSLWLVNSALNYLNKIPSLLLSTNFSPPLLIWPFSPHLALLNFSSHSPSLLLFILLSFYCFLLYLFLSFSPSPSQLSLNYLPLLLLLLLAFLLWINRPKLLRLKVVMELTLLQRKIIQLLSIPCRVVGSSVCVRV